jgi:Ca2+-dependent lipid-binding protein
VFDSKTGKVVQGQVFLAFAASVLIVKVHRISGFTDNAGWMDRTDPFVQLMYGKQKAKTKVKNNGGGNAEFNEVFFFDIIPADANGLEIAVLVCPLPRSHTDSV